MRRITGLVEHCAHLRQLVLGASIAPVAAGVLGDVGGDLLDETGALLPEQPAEIVMASTNDSESHLLSTPARIARQWLLTASFSAAESVCTVQYELAIRISVDTSRSFLIDSPIARKRASSMTTH